MFILSICSHWVGLLLQCSLLIQKLSCLLVSLKTWNCSSLSIIYISLITSVLSNIDFYRAFGSLSVVHIISLFIFDHMLECCLLPAIFMIFLGKKCLTSFSFPLSCWATLSAARCPLSLPFLLVLFLSWRILYGLMPDYPGLPSEVWRFSMWGLWLGLSHSRDTVSGSLQTQFCCYCFPTSSQLFSLFAACFIFSHLWEFEGRNSQTWQSL